MTARAGITVLGASGHAKVVVATAQASGYEVVAVYDDNPEAWGSSVLGVPVLGALAHAQEQPYPAVLAIGNNRVRKRLAERLSCTWRPVVHPQAHVHNTVQLGPGTLITAGVVVQPYASIGAHVILNTRCSVDHDCVIEDFAHIAPGVTLCGHVHVGAGALVGVGSSAIPGIKIGAWSTIGGGAAVTQDIEPSSLAAGCPATLRRRYKD